MNQLNAIMMDPDELLIVVMKKDDTSEVKSDFVEETKTDIHLISVPSILPAILTPVRPDLASKKDWSSSNLQFATDSKDRFTRSFSEAGIVSGSQKTTICENIRRTKSLNSAGKNRSESGQTLGRKRLNKSFTKWIRKKSVAAVLASKCLSCNSPLLPAQISPFEVSSYSGQF